MKKVAIIIRDLRQLGGGEADVIVLTSGLNEKGIVPDIFSEGCLEPEKIKQFFNKEIEYNFRQVKKPYNRILRFLKEMFLPNPIKQYIKNYDFVYDFTNKPPVVSKSDKYLKHIYILNDARAQKTLLDKAYSLAIRLFAKLGWNKFQKFQPGVINVTQSKFVQDEIRSKAKTEVPYIYPPVNLKGFWSENTDRLNQVVSIGRFGPEKSQIDQLEIAKEFKALNSDLKFKLVGTLGAKRNIYYEMLNKFKVANNLDNTKLLADFPFIELKKMLANSKFFIHTTFEEHFGIVVVEAIAAGCIPIVHNSGGPAEIVQMPNLRFNNTKQAISILRRLEKASAEELQKMRLKLQADVEKFDESHFKEGFINYLPWFNE